MRKVLLTAAAAAVFATSSAYAMEDVFYVKANVGWNKMTKIHGLKSKNDVFFGVGAGYHVMDNVRVDLTFDHFVNPEHKKGNAKLKGDANSLLLNGFVDLFDVDAFKVFVGAGVGASQVKAKYSVTVGNQTASVKAKQKYNVAFAGYVGGAYEFAPGVSGELTYSYRDMGKTKKVEGGDSAHYRGHNLGAGVRFDI